MRRQVREERRVGASGLVAGLIRGLLLYLINLKVLRAHAQTNC
jgi:hypothetical protein